MNSSIERYTRLIVIGSIAAVIIGVIAVIVERMIGTPLFDPIAHLLSGVTSIWTTLVITVTVPLVFVFILRAILAFGNSKLLGQIGIYALLLHFAFVFIAFFLVFFIDNVMLPVLFTDQFTESNLSEQSNAMTAEISSMTILLDWSDQLRVVAAGMIQPVLMSAFVLALAGLLFFRRQSMRLLPLLDKYADWILKAVFILLLFMPVAILSVIFSMFKVYGVGLFTAFALFTVYQIIFILVFIGFLYFVAYLFASVKPRTLFRAMIPTYFVAASTRSSYASVASATESAHKALGYQEQVVESAIPFFLITFRFNRAFTPIMTLQFLAHCFGLNLELSLLISYFLFTLLATIGSPGLPGSTRFGSLPFYAAVGIPIQAYMFSKAVDDLPDIFKTILNVTYPVVLLSLVTHLKKALNKYIVKV